MSFCWLSVPTEQRGVHAELQRGRHEVSEVADLRGHCVPEGEGASKGNVGPNLSELDESIGERANKSKP